MKLLASLSLLAYASFAAALSCADFISKEYDYVIVGGGTAGLVLAARLSEDPKKTVGVIEAGQNFIGSPAVDTPFLSRFLQGNATYDWLLRTVPQAGLNNRTINVPRGKALGGSSAINLMIFNGASRSEYNSWATFGNKGWDWNGILPFMKRVEHFQNTDPFVVNFTRARPGDLFPNQGTHGPLDISFNTFYSDVVLPYFVASNAIGAPVDFNPDGGGIFGIYNSPRSVDVNTGTRSYSANTYFAYNAHRTNLAVLTGAQATKIEFDDTKKDGKATAKGVTFICNSSQYTVKAVKEVILSAGTYKTPQLLELSGIGNADLLSKYGIKSVVNLPSVGENLVDHPLVPTNYIVKPGLVTYDTPGFNATYAKAAQAQYASTHNGIYSASNSILTYLDLSYVAQPSRIKEIMADLDNDINAAPLTPLRKHQYDIQKSWLPTKMKVKFGQVEFILNPGYFGSGTPKPQTPYLDIVVCASHPFSRGNTHINSSDPLAVPQINPNYLSKKFDQDILLQGIKWAQSLSQQQPLASILVGRQDPAPNVTSDADIIQYIKQNVRTLHHPSGTAIMASQELGGVVDAELKVYGTHNLRVVDASVIPMQFATHQQKTVYSLAEKAASIIAKQSK